MDQDFIRFICFNVGHGSCALVSMPPKNAGENRRYGVIDCKDDDASCILAYLRNPLPDEKPYLSNKLELEFVTISHYHFDHFNGIDTLLGEDNDFFSAKRVLFPFNPLFALYAKPFRDGAVIEQQKQLQNIYKRTTFLFRTPKGRMKNAERFFEIHADKKYDWTEAIDNRLKIRGIAPTEAASISMDNFLADRQVDNFNFASAAIQITFDKTIVLFGGDVDNEEWERIVKSQKNGMLVPNLCTKGA